MYLKNFPDIVVKMGNNFSLNLFNLRQKFRANGFDYILLSMQNGFGNFLENCSDIEFFSGFTGSNGKAFIAAKDAVLLVDGRYVKQAAEQTDNSVWRIKQFPDYGIDSILSEFGSSGEVLAIIPDAISYASYVSIGDISKRIGITNISVSSDLLRDKTSSKTTLVLHDHIHVGENYSDRVGRLAAELSQGEILLIADQSMIGWLFGIRFSAANANKSILPNCVGLISKSEPPILFCDLSFPIDTTPNFDTRKLSEFEDSIRALPHNFRIICDYAEVPASFILSAQKEGLDTKDSRKKYSEFYCIKNKTEIMNQKNAAELTSLVFIKTLAFAENETGINETDVSTFFEETAKELPNFVDMSFNPISAFGEYTSIVHYNAKVCENFEICENSLFLFDAGIHFDNATTDMTRTIFIGNPNNLSDNIAHIYTTILKSVIMFSSAKFPNKSKACSIDSIARYKIWESGHDYQFGTGHGVGAFGNVHEPPRISQMSTNQMKAGMIVTVEPGIYKKNYGVRLENMLLTRQSNFSGFLEFETLSYIPFCRKLTDNSLLTASETEWLANYHKRTYEKFSQIFEHDNLTMMWLKDNTIC
jgi:Xaa-Pro aminopeptidase